MASPEPAQEPEPTVSKLFRVPLSLGEWLREESHRSRRSQNEVGVRALETYRDALERRRAKS
jgi:hypothetical protein